MKVWMIFVQGDDATWLESAWDDESTAENHDGWQAEVDRVHKLAFENSYEVRVLEVNIAGVYETFEPPRLSGSVASPRKEQD